MFKRLLSLLLAALLLVSVMPALAEEESAPAEEPAPVSEPAPAPSEPEPAPAEPDPTPADPAPAPADPEPDPTPADPEPDPAPADPQPDPEPEGEGDGYHTIEEMTGGGEYEKPVTMYVYTENGGTLNVRSEPFVKKGNVIGTLQYGETVQVLGSVVIDGDWLVISYKKGPDGVGYVMRRYLVSSKPAAKPQKSEEEIQREKDMAELNRQLGTFRELAKPLLISVRATRSTGWINFRVGPGVAADRIASFPDGRQLKAIAETDKWWQAVDLETGRTGYISKGYTTVIGELVEQVPAPAKESLGTLNVNGEFAIQCALPAGYSLQVVNMQGSKIVASILSEDTSKPMLYLSIAYSEIYSDVERMNDLGEEDLAVLEASFREMNDVEITYRETAYGTKLLVAREVGDDTDFVDILTVYKGYNVEFIMTPNPEGSNHELTEEQIQMCIDFLSEVDFVAPSAAPAQPIRVPNVLIK